MLSQSIEPASENSDIVVVHYLNGVRYGPDELKLFTDTVCAEVGLKNLKTAIEHFRYEHYQTMEHIKDISNGFLDGYASTSVSETSKVYHKALFDVLYIKKMEELPLMVNGDEHIVPVVMWRFQIGK